MNTHNTRPVTSRQGEDIDGLVQERCNSSALAMELCLSCTNPSIWYQQKRHKTTTNALKLHLLCINSLWPSGDMDLGQRGLRYWLAATWHQAIT